MNAVTNTDCQKVHYDTLDAEAIRAVQHQIRPELMTVIVILCSTKPVALDDTSCSASPK